MQERILSQSIPVNSSAVCQSVSGHLNGLILHLGSVTLDGYLTVRFDEQEVHKTLVERVPLSVLAAISNAKFGVKADADSTFIYLPLGSIFSEQGSVRVTVENADATNSIVAKVYQYSDNDEPEHYLTYKEIVDKNDVQEGVVAIFAYGSASLEGDDIAVTLDVNGKSAHTDIDGLYAETQLTGVLESAETGVVQVYESPDEIPDVVAFNFTGGDVGNISAIVLVIREQEHRRVARAAVRSATKYLDRVRRIRTERPAVYSALKAQGKIGDETEVTQARQNASKIVSRSSLTSLM